MKKCIFYIIVCFLCRSLQAQNIEGVVYDSKTKEPIPGVAIYLRGTSIITTSNKDGKFLLSVERVVNTTLEFSHLSYESLTIEKPFEHQEKAYYLKEKVSTLSEVRVVSDRYSREDKMRVFKEEFLGRSAAGKSCIIVNEEDIVLHYDSETTTLICYAINPIVIENKYLAYRITFDLHNFAIQYTENTLNMNKAKKVFFTGASSFADQSPYNILYAKRRLEVYLRSSQSFFKNLATNTLEESKFRIFNRFRQIKLDQYFTVVDAKPFKMVLINPDTDLSRRHSSVDEEPIYGVLGINCNSMYRSDVVFLINRFSVDEFGNISAVDKVVFFGDMGDQRLGDMLPMDFIP